MAEKIVVNKLRMLSSDHSIGFAEIGRAVASKAHRHTLVLRRLCAGLLLLTMMQAGPAIAQHEISDIAISGKIQLVSDYRLRGLSRSDGKPTIQGGVDIDHINGFYAGGWASSIRGRQISGDAQIDLYAGWSDEITSGLVLNAGLQHHIFAGKGKDRAKGHVGPGNYFEPYATLSGQLGPVGATLGVAYAWQQKALSKRYLMGEEFIGEGDIPAQNAFAKRDNLYLHGDLDAAIPGTPVTLTGHLGYTRGALASRALAGRGRNGFDWALGARISARGRYDFGVSYMGTSGRNLDDYTDDAVVTSLSMRF